MDRRECSNWMAFHANKTSVTTQGESPLAIPQNDDYRTTTEGVMVDTSAGDLIARTQTCEDYIVTSTDLLQGPNGRYALYTRRHPEPDIENSLNDWGNFVGCYLDKYEDLIDEGKMAQAVIATAFSVVMALFVPFAVLITAPLADALFASVASAALAVTGGCLAYRKFDEIAPDRGVFDREVRLLEKQQAAQWLQENGHMALSRERFGLPEMY